MSIKEIHIGDRVEITNNDVDEKYTSQIENIVNNDEIIVHMPIYFGKLVKLEINKNYKLLFFTDKGIIIFETKVLQHVNEEGFNLTAFKLIDRGKRIQRREFFRFTCYIKANFITNRQEENKEEDKQDKQDEEDKIVAFNGIIKDIGAGGIRFLTNQRLEENISIKASFSLNDKVLTTAGRIICRQYTPDTDFEYQYRVEFIDLAESNQEKIIRYIFSEERKQLQRIKA